MGNNAGSASAAGNLPSEFFSKGSFLTLTGSASVTWIVASVLCGVVNAKPETVGLIVAIVVAYVGFFLASGPRKPVQYVVTLFNGFLIYATVVGGTSFLPLVNDQTAQSIQDDKPSIASVLTRPWVPDKNIVEAAKNLVAANEAQETRFQAIRRRPGPAGATAVKQAETKLETSYKALEKGGLVVRPGG
jgi:hypothetical protein